MESYVDPYAGVILASPCPVGCPFCPMDRSTPLSDDGTGSVDIAYSRSLFSHSFSPVEDFRSLPWFGSYIGSIGVANPPPAFRDSSTSDPQGDSDTQWVVDHRDCSDYTVAPPSDHEEQPYPWRSPSSSMLATLIEKEDPAVALSKERTLSTPIPDLTIAQPSPQYPNAFSGNDGYCGRRVERPLLHLALDDVDRAYGTVFSVTPHASPEAATIPRWSNPLSPYLQPMRSRLTCRLPHCRTTVALYATHYHALAVSTSPRAAGRARPRIHVCLSSELVDGQDNLIAVKHLLGRDSCALSRHLSSRRGCYPYSGVSRTRRIQACA